MGAPGKTVNGQVGAGAVLVTSTVLGDRLITQNTPQVPGVAEAGDGFGTSVAGEWIGVPGEAVGRLAGAGMIQRWDLEDPAGWIGLTQNSRGVTGKVEAGDHFGAALAEAHGYADDTEYFPLALYIGVPGEDVGSVADAGTVDVIAENDFPEDVFRYLGGAGAATMPTPQRGAEFGSALALGNEVIRVGAPGAGGGSGRVLTYTGTTGVGVPDPPRLRTTWSQDTGANESGDRFGGALATASN